MIKYRNDKLSVPAIIQGLGPFAGVPAIPQTPKSGKTSSNQNLSELKDVRYMVPLNIRSFNFYDYL